MHTMIEHDRPRRGCGSAAANLHLRGHRAGRGWLQHGDRRAGQAARVVPIAALGRLLFFDRALSADGQVSCATCHQPERACSDGLAHASGVAGEHGTRNTPSLLDVGRQRSLFWDGRRTRLEDQALDPLLNRVEHGLHGVTATQPLPDQLGEPEARDSSKMPGFKTQWIYASRGLTLHIDDNSGNIAFVYAYRPMTVDEFRASWLSRVEIRRTPAR